LDGRGPHRMMSNSFAFGGNNISLILGSAEHDEVAL
jgi:3-oxoacyl-[acyl-carrier-protein] synthase-1